MSDSTRDSGPRVWGYLLWPWSMVPGVPAILLAVVWLASDKPSVIRLDVTYLVPDVTSFKQIVFLAGVILAVCGMELSAVHAQEGKNPQRDYPKAILLSAVLILVIYVLGSMAVAVVVPAKSLSLVKREVEELKSSELEDRIAAVTVVPYPPGIPMIMPGERFSADSKVLVDYLRILEKFDRAFPGFETEIHGVNPKKEDTKLLYYIASVK